VQGKRRTCTLQVLWHGLPRYVGWCIIAQDLVAITRADAKPKANAGVAENDYEINANADRLLQEITELAPQALFGKPSETYLRCGNRKCRCTPADPKWTHLYLSYRGPVGKTTGYYVPEAGHAAVRNGVEAWARVQALNKEQVIPSKPRRRRKNSAS